MAKTVEEIANKSLGKAEIRKCTCVNAWQDKKYGHSMRVQNVCEKGYRCTCCAAINFGNK